jgi:hypothetical protein
MMRTRMVSAAIIGALMWAAPSNAGEVSEELYHARDLLEKADRDYNGHRGKAAAEVRHALQHLGHDPNANQPKIAANPVHEKQSKSDEQLKHARELLKKVEAHLHEKKDPKHHAARESIGKAIEEIDVALKTK